MKNRTIIIMFICCLQISICYGYLCLNPIIVVNKSRQKNEFLSDSLFNPLSYGKVDFAKGNNKVILYINRQDIPFLPGDIKKWTLLECRNNRIIELIKKHFYFERISDDHVETTAVGSKIFFLKDCKIIFQSEIIIDNNISLYFDNAGWAFSKNDKDLIKCFSEFKPVYFPIIKID